MQQQFPIVIQHKYGEKITFLRMEGQRIIAENMVEPNAGPPMHIHYLQDEGFTVIAGKIGYQIQGEAPKYGFPGDTVVFKRGVAHRFWNAGDDVLQCSGWVEPGYNIVFFLTNIFKAIDKGKDQRPEMFDGAYLSYRYRHEFAITEIPAFVRNVVFPATYFVGKLLGKYQKFKNAPEPAR